MTRSDGEQLEERLGHRFTRPELLERALTHSSAVPGMRSEAGEVSSEASAAIHDNERMEFLGDAVLGLLTSEYLLETFPDWSEGQLSKGRSRLVNARALHDAARRIHLGDYLNIGPGEEKTGGREKPALLADALEAVIAAVYLDGGLETTREMLERLLFEQALEERGEGIADLDRKSALQEYLQGGGHPPAEYRLAAESGPDHQKTFHVEVWVEGEPLAHGEGSTKKEAEQRAAQSALELLERKPLQVDRKG
jgi:ribonuclease III